MEAGAWWARAVNVFLNSGLIAPGTTLVAIGDSAGSVVLYVSHSVQSSLVCPRSSTEICSCTRHSAQATKDHALDHPFVSFVMVEPPMMTREIYERHLEEDTVFSSAVDVAEMRKDKWPSVLR